MGLGLHKFISSISSKLSISLFNQRLPLEYVLYNYLFRLLIVKKNSQNTIIKNFHDEGYSKLNVNLKDDLNKYLDKVKIDEAVTKELQSERNKRIVFTHPDDDKFSLYKDLERKLSPVIKDLSEYYNSEVHIFEIKLFRIKNENIDKNLNKDVYSNNFHQDSYTMNYIKIGINLMDITENDGPMEIVKIKNRKNFVKSFKYKDRDNYKVDGDENLIHKNTGKLGDCFLFSSVQCFHKAGEPNNYRDIIQVILVAPTKNQNYNIRTENKLNLFNQNKKIIYELTKPYGRLKTAKIFFEHLKEVYKNKKVYN